MYGDEGDVQNIEVHKNFKENHPKSNTDQQMRYLNVHNKMAKFYPTLLDTLGPTSLI